MSGRGVVSVRLPRSLLKELRTASLQRGKTVHDDVRAVVARLEDFGAAQMRGLPDPPREPGRVRLSLYPGPDGIRQVNSAAHKSGLPRSVLLLRLLKALPELRGIRHVKLNNKQKDANSSGWRSSLLFAAIFLVPIITAVLGVGIPTNLQANSIRPIYE